MPLPMLEFVVILICLLLNAVLAAIEIAFVTVAKPEVRQRAKAGDKRAQSLLLLRSNPERTLSVLQIGITLVGAVSAAVAGMKADNSLTPLLLEHFRISDKMASVISIICSVLPLTYFSVVIGELVPKTIALRYPRWLALKSANWLQLGDRLLGPAVWVLEKSTRLFLRLLLVPIPKVGAEDHSSISLETLSVPHRQFVMNLVQIEGKRVKDIMVPWTEVDFIQTTHTAAEVLSKIVACRHTRLPVVDEDGHVLGVLHSKEFLSFASTGDPNWISLVRNPSRVQISDEILKTLKSLQESKRHLALVYASEELKGVVTLEDIMEEVIGEIYDEDDDGFIQKILTQRLKRAEPRKG